MVTEKIVFDNYDFESCKQLHYKLCAIMDGISNLRLLEEIHSKSGNELFNTSKSYNDRVAMFVEAYNDLIIEYVTKPIDR